MTLLVENQHFASGLRLENQPDVVIRRCTVSHRDGNHGIELVNCGRVRIESCQVRGVGDPRIMLRPAGPEPGSPILEEFIRHQIAGIRLLDCRDAEITDTEVTDIIGCGIHLGATESTRCQTFAIRRCRISYIYDDGIYLVTKGDQGTPATVLPLRGGVIADNLIHDIGLGLTRLPFARHGLYLKSRDVLVEGNEIYNCLYGGGVSLRNAGVVRRNFIRNCMSGVAYWAQTNTTGSSREVVIEENNIEQDFRIRWPMRHVDRRAEPIRHDPRSAAGITVQFNPEPWARLDAIRIRKNRVQIGVDYESENVFPVAGFGDPAHAPATFEFTDNTLLNHRSPDRLVDNLPPLAATLENTGLNSLARATASR